jgi:hypothetical protein
MVNHHTEVLYIAVLWAAIDVQACSERWGSQGVPKTFARSGIPGKNQFAKQFLFKKINNAIGGN